MFDKRFIEGIAQKVYEDISFPANTEYRSKVKKLREELQQKTKDPITKYHTLVKPFKTILSDKESKVREAFKQKQERIIEILKKDEESEMELLKSEYSNNIKDIQNTFYKETSEAHDHYYDKLDEYTNEMTNKVNLAKKVRQEILNLVVLYEDQDKMEKEKFNDLIHKIIQENGLSKNP